MLSVQLVLNSTTVGGTPNTELRRVIPGGFTAAKDAVAVIRAASNFTWDSGNIVAQVGSNLLRFYYGQTGAANWAATTNGTSVQGAWAFEIQ